MRDGMKRRDFLHASAAIVGAAAGGFSCVEIAGAAPVQVPTVDRLTMSTIIDSSHDVFLRPSEVQGVKHQPPGGGRGTDFRQILHNQWGLSLLLESGRGDEARTILLDFGYSPDALLNNIAILKIDPAKIAP
jgi:7,8-dihydropterin-6-yl-methyl-4-(beta-D-ribofuranosyl)aminobenzene 5'-phosphate synthase